MANAELDDLTELITPQAADWLAIHDGGTDLQKLSYAFLGLEDVAGGDADTAMDVGKLYVVDMSAWATASRTYTLPGAASVKTGQRIGIMITGGNATHSLILATNTTGDLINGTDESAGSTKWRLFITGEMLVLRCVNGTTGDWFVEYDGRIPCQTRIYLQSAAVNLLAVSGTYYQVPMDTTDDDRGGLANLAGDDIVVRRAGRYLGVAITTAEDSLADNSSLSINIRINNGATTLSSSNVNIAGASTFRKISLADVINLAIGDTVENWSRQDGNSNIDVDGSTSPAQTALQVMELF